MPGRKSLRDLGIRQFDMEFGRLILVQGSPDDKEIFLLREIKGRPDTHDKELIPPNLRQHAKDAHRVSLTRFDGKNEELMGKATFVPLKDSIYLSDLHTEPRYRKRDIASSLIAYVKTNGKDIWLVPTVASRPFYRKLGFFPSVRHGGWELPEKKQLAKMPLEAGSRKFLVMPRKAVKK